MFRIKSDHLFHVLKAPLVIFPGKKLLTLFI